MIFFPIGAIAAFWLVVLIVNFPVVTLSVIGGAVVLFFANGAYIELSDRYRNYRYYHRIGR